jgi:hypothetical protein
LLTARAALEDGAEVGDKFLMAINSRRRATMIPTLMGTTDEAALYVMELVGSQEEIEVNHLRRIDLELEKEKTLRVIAEADAIAAKRVQRPRALNGRAHATIRSLGLFFRPHKKR